MPKARTRICLEHGLKLDLNRLLRQRSVRSGERTGPQYIQWQCGREIIAYGSITANMEGSSQGSLVLQLGDLQQTLALRAMPRHFGGRQWYFVCPRTDSPASVLWKPPGARQFASRRCWGRQVAYASQFETPLDRALRAKAKIKTRLVADPGLDECDFPAKPKWMRWRTYERYVEKHDHYEAIIDQQFWRVAARLAGVGVRV